MEAKALGDGKLEGDRRKSNHLEQKMSELKKLLFNSDEHILLEKELSWGLRFWKLLIL